MATPDRIPSGPLAALEQLRAEPHRFSLFAALRLLERADTSRPRLGEARRPDEELARLEQPPHLLFAPADIATFEPAAGGRYRLEQYGFGMFGPNGALPFHLTEYAFERRRHHEDAVLSDFVNLFQHRLVALFYRAWAQSDPATSFARPGRDDFSSVIGALVGLLDRTEPGAVAVHGMLGSPGRYAPNTRSADGLEAVLQDYFELPITIRQFVGSWLSIPEGSRSRLGVPGPSATLGDSATLGASSWQCQSRFEIVIGPLRFEQFLSFVPGSRALRELASIVRLYTNGEWAWQARLLVAEQDVPGMALGQVGRLGWTSWLGHKRDLATDVVLQGA